MSPALVVAAAVLAAVIAGACGGDDSADPAETSTTAAPDTTTTASTSTTTSTTSEAPTTTEAPVETVLGAELVGRWAHFDIVAYEDPTMKTQIVSYGITDFTIDDGRLIETDRFCFSEQRSDQPIETSLSDAATQAIVPVPVAVEVSVENGILRVRRPATPTPLGIRLDDPANEPLPTDPNDPRLVDDDGDGNLGVTVRIRVSDDLQGELYIARREIFAYDMTLDGPDRLTGTVTDGSEQLVIGASDPIFASVEGQWTQHPDLSNSPIHLVRVADDFDCTQLRAQRDDLFPPVPDIDW